ncbi:uncharacterized protein [Physcomitrium patens]|uniref:Uncharacterized protein n=1 Tax=Physcomitrium patens TaxID=3218 RepID=A0A2K1JVS8_PHYPA|nr:uncharacterized protein LOC112288552 [Physcomitrium patens]PNR45631.1 hypothetical protein PHYPA_015402 [Physcomitrium patens]|eukprot:XP_024388591.1 uncharacterized protein LOC112288552 [Physcomitrella patens]
MVAMALTQPVAVQGAICAAAQAAAQANAGSGLCVWRPWGMRQQQLRGKLGCVVVGGGVSKLGMREVNRRRVVVVAAMVDDEGGENGSVDGAASRGDEVAPVEGGAAANVDAAFQNRRDVLLEYVKNVQPDFMERFVQKAPAQVVDAMRQTVTNMLGSLPPQFFNIHVSTIAENLAQLMYSVMMTGYMFRNAQYRLELQQSLNQVAPPVASNALTDSRYAPGTQKSTVSGEVLRWHKDEERPESVDAVEYIELLENEVEQLRKQLELRGRGKNELLEYLKSLQPQNLQELTTSAGEDALEAMNTFITRLIGVAEPDQLKKTATQTTTAELARILYWLMVVGYSIRSIEVRYDMERVLGVPPKLAELPPGETL